MKHTYAKFIILKIRTPKANKIFNVLIVGINRKETEMKKIIALAVVAAACSTTAMAQSVGNIYGDVAYGMVTLKDTSAENNSGTFKTTAGRFTLGTVVTNNVAVEGFITQGLAGDSKATTAAILM